MNDQQPPAFLFYVNDFIVGTEAMTLSEVGLYVLLLAHEWRNGGPIDLLKTCGQIFDRGELRVRNRPQLVRKVGLKFKVTDTGQHFSPRLEAERQKVLKAYEHRRPGGRARANGAERIHGRFAPARSQHDAG